MLETCNVLMARQPIHDKALNVVGYELLYRTPQGLGTGRMGLEAQAKALANVVVEIGLDRLVESKPAFVNVPASLLEIPALQLLPQDRVILELLEDLVYDAPTKKALKALARCGYKLALDDYIFEDSQAPFLAHVGIVKVDVLQTSPEILRSRTRELKLRKLKLLAEKVETEEMFLLCSSLGYELFQGYFFSKPALISAKVPASNRTSAMDLIAKLQEPDATIDELEETISHDATLAYRLLKVVNCAALGLASGLTSLRQTIMLLGLERVAAFATLLTMASVPGRSSELLALGAIRARLAESLAVTFDYRYPKKHFTVGLLSVLDAIVGCPMQDLLEAVPLAKDLKAALLGQGLGSELGFTLNAARLVETCQLAPGLEEFPGPGEIMRLYMEAIEWASSIRRAAA